ncbi:metal-sulfur cluster assembly factor [Sporolactobacillus sp. CPB3-1]|jgi:metal-sulfur cluster biosynthetic enzyme|uniref:DNA methyltransferase n=2 Tax=Sporolactobacillus TaxID=2077 RepID=V6J801_9BACL|nr:MULTISPECIES: metal-sulfur cluster assembly factor [Sporolactobacillus]EST12914.1 DNA methyltransferase [Sporolactobacillus laevolacticus DSM 442]MCL1632874.1 metal-sulfur cluster assembly factor [Sporolactobacillus mangiferae]MDF2909557.1 iron donor protein CyaY [Sporolactobacillus laevolacticus]MDN3954218.1 metal-sulfur cluster assembly factor [Sporolactobacillus laevolacticus]
MAENSSNEELKDRVLEALEDVIDPELGVDIVNLGLVYGVDIDEENNVVVTMTLTFMGCPLSATLSYDVKRTLGEIEEVNEVEVNFVWDPPWTKERMSRYARIALGLSE